MTPDSIKQKSAQIVVSTRIVPGCVQFLGEEKRFHTAWTLIGLTLLEVSAVNAGGGFSAKSDGSFGSLENLGLAALVILVILVFNGSRSRYLRMLSVVLGLLAGYCAALILGQVDLAAMRAMPFLTVVCTENSNPDVVMVKPAEDRV